MKSIHLKFILSAFFIIGAFNTLRAQNTIAVIKYEEAEKAFYEADYNLVLERLKETEDILGQTAPKILHLRILAQNKLYEQNPFASFERLDDLRRNVSYYISNYDIVGLEQKYRDVYDIHVKLENAPNTLTEFVKAEKEAEAEKQRLKREKEEFINSLYPMVFVEGGSIKLRGANKYPTYTLSNYYIGSYEVTQKFWKYVMNSLPENNIECDECAVTNISWSDANEFITKLNSISGNTYRLPTEAEWEFAAMGGNLSKGFKFSGSNNGREVGHFLPQSNLKRKLESPQAVGTLLPNELGIYDMSGNVREWCSDWYNEKYSNSEGNQNSIESTEAETINNTYKVLKGGSYRSLPQKNHIILSFDLNYEQLEYGYQYYREILKQVGLRLVYSSPE